MSKRKYLVVFRNPASAQKAGAASESMQPMFAAYKAWMEQFKDDILDLGDKLKSEGRVVTASAVRDGPYVEAKEVIVGYMIVAAANYDGAVEVVRACPAVNAPGASLEIREMMQRG